MDIPSYQIHNVLRDYVRQLRKRVAAESVRLRIHPASAPEKRRRVRERITAEIVERIVHLNVDESRGGPEVARPYKPAMARKPFVYQVLQPDRSVVRYRLRLKSPEDLMRRFEETSRSAAEKT
ncbi:MAG: hypothetical protein PVH30_12575 [Desulfobacterales bacterium]|jgi:hypothetical protein